MMAAHVATLLSLLSSLLTAPAVGLSNSLSSRSPWSEALSSVRSSQTELHQSIEDWVTSAQAFNTEWTAALSASSTAAQQALMTVKEREAQVKALKMQKCPVACQMDAMKMMAWQSTPDYGRLNREAADLKRQAANHQVDLGNVQFLEQSLNAFSPRVNRLHFQAQQELERFEQKISSEIESRLPALLTQLRSRQVEVPPGAIEAVVAPFDIKKGRIEGTKKYCTAYAAYKDASQKRQDRIVARHEGIVEGHANTKAHFQKHATEWSAKQDVYQQLMGAFFGICTREVQEYAREAGLTGSLEPSELAQAFRSEIDDHHDWWSANCKGMKTSSQQIISWMASRQETFTNGQIKADEHTARVGEAPEETLPAPPAATDTMCAQDFDTQLKDIDSKINDFRNGGGF